jgi:glycine oxidase
MRPDICVVGGGLVGRCLAWRASKAGARVALYDAAGSKGESSAAWVAAGMIAPFSEAIDGSPQIECFGRRSLAVWPQWLAELPMPVFYRDDGTLLLWHRQDSGEATRAEKLFAARRIEENAERIEGDRLSELEPALGTRFSEALHIAGEAHIDNRGLLEAVASALTEGKVECHWGTFITNGALPDAGTVVDCRGMGAKSEWRELRGVRGEIIRLKAPDIELRHMLRLLHPRYAVYIVPRPDGRLIVGATSLEGEDRSTISVRGVLELLSSAYSVLPGLAEARILEFNTQVRPALPDNVPAIRFDRKCRVLSINGLYRHGFLLTPAIVEDALALLSIANRSKTAGQAAASRGDEVHACL